MSNPLKKSWKRFKAFEPVAHPGRGRHSNAEVSLSVSELKLLESIPGAVCICNAGAEVIWMNKELGGLLDTSTHFGQLACFGDYLDPGSSSDLLRTIMRVAANGTPETCRAKSRSIGPAGGKQQLELRLSCYRPSDCGDAAPSVLILATKCAGKIHSAQKTDNAVGEGVSHFDPMTRLLAETSHEMRTPLNAIIGFAELLEGQAGQMLEPAKQSEYTKLIATTARQMLEMADDLIDLSKLRSQNREMRCEEIDMLSLADDVVLSLQPLLRKKSILVSVNADQNLPTIKSDERVLRQILVNLVSNACKFSDPNSDILIQLSRSFKSVDVAIIDYGSGIAPENLSRLGNEFFREEKESGTDGNGLGLSIVYRLLEQIDGKISVESKPGEGSTFTVSLPMANAAAKPIPTNPDGDIVYLKPQSAGCASRSAYLPMTETKQKLAQ